jgi:hypothetical protein
MGKSLLSFMQNMAACITLESMSSSYGSEKEAQGTASKDENE